MFLRQVLLSIILLLGVNAVYAQNLEYGVELDTNYMLIGDQQRFTFKVRSDEEARILFPQLKDTVVNGVEIISGPRRDSVWEKDGKWVLTEQYVITAFDTGVYVIPPMPITIKGAEFDNVLRTDPIAFAVNTYEIDPQKGNYDIVMPYAAPWNLAEILPYLLWSLLGLAVIAAAWYLWQRHKKHKSLFMPPKEVIPPYVQAIRSLDSIKDEKLWQPGNEKKCDKIEATECEKIKDMLTTADYVKFAKFTPLQDENARYLDSAYDFVNTTHQRLEAEIAEEKRKEEEKRKLQAEEKKAEDEIMKKE